MEPRIFTLASVPTTVQLGPATEVEVGETCPVCNLQPRREFRSVELVFDIWDGEDLVTAINVYAVSERLRNAIERGGLTGARFDDIQVTKADYFEIGPDAYAEDPPRFYRLTITGSAGGPELWWTSEYCEACGVRSWERTEDGMDAEMALAFGEPAPPRQVYRGSWSGHDSFRLEDPGPLLVTERVKDLFESLPVKEVSFQPAEWVDE
jgi:hypothetical protein